MENKIRVFEYVPQGVCSRMIHVEINENNIIEEAYFVAGCSGNTQGVCALAKGMDAKEVIKRLKGTDCGGRGTSCPDQLARAIEEAISSN